MSAPDKMQCIEELLRKSLLGDKIIDTEFHLFSAKSMSSDRVTHPRTLCANNIILANSSKYFFDREHFYAVFLRDTASPVLAWSVLNPPTRPDTFIKGHNQHVPMEIRIGDYGYGSDSDLEDEDPAGKSSESRTSSAPLQPQTIQSESINEPSEGGSLASDIFILNADNDQRPDDVGPSTSGVVVQGSIHDVVLVDETDAFPHSFTRRHIVVPDTAFQTWYTLLYYLYTGKVNFHPLKSASPQSQRPLSCSVEAPMCSAKSMYRLATKVDLHPLRDKALSFLRNNITERNILSELTSSLLSRYPPLLKMELDVLYSYIDSATVVTGLPALAKRITHNEFSHGADIFIGLHQMLLKKHHPPNPLPQAAIVFSCTPKDKIIQGKGSGKGQSAGDTKKKKGKKEKKEKKAMTSTTCSPNPLTTTTVGPELPLEVASAD